MARLADCRIASPAWLIGGVAVVVLMIYCALLHATDSSRANDSWRRTAAGWERSDSWPPATWAVPHPVHDSEQLRTRNDSHPAALALVETLVVALGFYLFPAGSKTAPRGNYQTWVARSFRASAFGR